jgi:hypothetical protein
MANTRELVIHRSYVLIYDLAEGDLVRILPVLHTALQWPPIDPELLHSPERANLDFSNVRRAPGVGIWDNSFATMDYRIHEGSPDAHRVYAKAV